MQATDEQGTEQPAALGNGLAFFEDLAGKFPSRRP